MANPQNTTALPRNAKAAPRTNSMATIAWIAAWALPGLGHFIQHRWIRGLLIMTAIFVMFFCGLAMQGKVYAFNTGDLLDVLGFIGDLGTGLLYFVARMMNWGIGNIRFAIADYGTKYIVVAGLLNVVAAVDAYHIAIGKKQ